MLFVKLPVAFAIILSSLLSTTALAESANSPATVAEPIYQVEFLVLRPYQRNELDKETWSLQKPNTPFPLSTQTTTAERSDPLAVDAVLASLKPNLQSNGQAITQLKGFSWVNEAQWNLPFTIKRINRGGEYEILMHKVWRQTATSRNQLAPLTVALPFDASNGVVSESQLAYQTSAGDNQNGLFGNFAFSKGRYLHLTMDFVLAEAQAPAAMVTEQYGFSRAKDADGESTPFSFGLDQPEAVIQYYRLNETRRIKTDETHYFDHPAFSVLAYVSKIERAPAQAPPVE